MKKVIFLDFDGVLATSRYSTQLDEEGQLWTDCYGSLFDPVCIRNLKSIIDATGADIVATSTWKMQLGLDGIRAMWNERRLPGNVIGVTPDTDILCRGSEIDEWLAGGEEEYRYAIIDDAPFTSFFTEHQQKHLFKVDERTGLDEETSQRIIVYLNGHDQE